jgi:hypothetical protein
MVIMTLVSIPLMEKRGRRFLHLLGLGGMWLFSILMTIALVLKQKNENMKYLSIVSMMLYIVFFALGPGSIPWVRFILYIFIVRLLFNFIFIR